MNRRFHIFLFIIYIQINTGKCVEQINNWKSTRISIKRTVGTAANRSLVTHRIFLLFYVFAYICNKCDMNLNRLSDRKKRLSEQNNSTFTMTTLFAWAFHGKFAHFSSGNWLFSFGTLKHGQIFSKLSILWMAIKRRYDKFKLGVTILFARNWQQFAFMGISVRLSSYRFKHTIYSIPRFYVSERDRGGGEVGVQRKKGEGG